jgi:hypothetical protein
MSEIVTVEAAAQGPCLDAVFVPRFVSQDDWKPKEEPTSTCYGSYLCEFEYGVTREYKSFHGRVEAEKLVGLWDHEMARVIRHAEFSTDGNCECRACRGQVREVYPWTIDREARMARREARRAELEESLRREVPTKGDVQWNVSCF